MMNHTILHLSKKSLLAAAGLASIASVVFAGSMLHSQVAASVMFDAASVKPTPPGRDFSWGSCRGTDSSDREGPWIGSRILPGMSVPGRPALGRCSITGATLKAILRAAYDLA